MWRMLFPEYCHICGYDLTQGERFVCSPCLASLRRTDYHLLPLNPMEEKLAGGPQFIRATGFFFYERCGSVSTLIQDMKYRSFPSIGEILGGVMARALKDSGFFEGIDLLQPVPMNRWKEWDRGYNQAKSVARGVSAETGIAICDNLRARRRHGSQTHLGVAEREANMRDYFKSYHPEEIEGRHLLIIDDVCTTGATLRNCAAPLSQIPGVSISYLTLATT